MWVVENTEEYGRLILNLQPRFFFSLSSRKCSVECLLSHGRKCASRRICSFSDIFSFRESLPFLLLLAWKQTSFFSVLFNRKVVFIQIEQSGSLLYTYKRLEDPAFLDILRRFPVYLKTLSDHCDLRLGCWTFLSSLLAVKFINWSRTLLSLYTTFCLKILSFALFL